MRREKTVKRRPPSIDALRSLVAFADTGRVTAAAQQLGVSQPVVTRKLEVFETPEACGAIVLKRTARGLELTEAGRSSLADIRALVRDYDQVMGCLAGRRDTSQLVRIGSGSFAAEHYLPKALAGLHDREQEVDVQTEIARGADRIAGTADGTYDMAIVSHSRAQIDEIVRRRFQSNVRLRSVSLAKHSLCVVAGKRSEWAGELNRVRASQPVPLAMLRQWPLLGLDTSSGVRRQLEEHFARPEDLHFLAEGGGWTAAKAFAGHGLGVAIIPRLTLSAAEERQFVVRRLADQFVISDHLIHRARDLSRGEEAVLEAILRVARRFEARVEGR